MIKFFKKIFEGLNLEPKSTSTSTKKGDLEVLSGDGRLYYNDGTTNDKVVSENSTDTLENKTIDGDDNTISDLALSSLKTNLTDASKFVQRDALGDVVSNLKAVPTGDVVGTSDTQTLSGKTIDADANTITNIENADIKAGAAIDATKIADGSVTSTEFQYLGGVTSDIQTQFGGKVAKAGDTMSGNLDMGANKVTSSATPSGANDYTTKSYVDSLIENLDPKAAARVATTGPGTLATDFENGDTIDGQVLATGDRILIKNQTAQEENGIYVVQATGAPVRSSDANTWDELVAAQIFIQAGTVNNNTGWFCTILAGGTLGVDPVTFTQQSGVGVITTDGQGIEISGNQLSLELNGTSLQKSSSGLSINSGLTLTGTTVARSTSGDINISPSSGEINLTSRVNASGVLSFLGALQGSAEVDSTSTGASVTLAYPAKFQKILTNASLTSVNNITSGEAAIFVLTNYTGNPIEIINSGLGGILTGTGDNLDLLNEASITLVYSIGLASWVIVGGSGGGGTSRIVTGTFSSPIEISTSGITALLEVDEDIFVDTASGEVNITANPQISAGDTDGQTLRIIGTSNDNYILLEDGNGLSIQGSFASYLNNILVLRYDLTQNIWVEVTRSQ